MRLDRIGAAVLISSLMAARPLPRCSEQYLAAQVDWSGQGHVSEVAVHVRSNDQHLFPCARGNDRTGGPVKSVKPCAMVSPSTIRRMIAANGATMECLLYDIPASCATAVVSTATATAAAASNTQCAIATPIALVCAGASVRRSAKNIST